MKRSYLITGIASPAVYAFTVFLGGVLWQDYSHVNQAISELTATGAPFRLTLNILFTISLILAVIFAVNALRFVRQFNKKVLTAGMGALLTVTTLSLLWAFFPMDPHGAEPTTAGIIHLVLAGIVSPLTIISPVLVWVGFRKIADFQGYAVYSLLSAILIFVTGILTVFSAQSGATFFGVYERLTIGSYQQWMAGSALFFYLRWKG